MTGSSFQPDKVSGSTFGTVLKQLERQPRLATVRRVAGPSVRDFFETFASEGRPVILEGLVPASVTDPQETMRILRTAIGPEIVTARYGYYADPQNYVAKRLTRRLTVAAYLDILQTTVAAEERLYLANEKLPRHAVNALGLDTPPYYPAADLRKPRIWLGPAGSITPLHKDGSDNFALHLFGAKKWVLFPVRDYPRLYLKQPQPRSLPGFAISEIDVRRPDHGRFRLYRHARAVEVEVHAGETLYLPAGWAHYVETTTATLMVNYWVNNQRRPPACLENGLS